MTNLPKILKIKESEALLKMPLDYTDYRHHVNHPNFLHGYLFRSREA